MINYKYSNLYIYLFTVIAILMVKLSSSLFLSKIAEFLLLNFLLIIFILLYIKKIGLTGIQFRKFSLFIFILIFHFFLKYCITNLGLLWGYSLPQTDLASLVKSQYLVIIACLSFSLGYSNSLGKKIGSTLSNLPGYKNIISYKNYSIRFFVSIFILIFSILVNVLGISYGILGYASSQQLTNTTGIYIYSVQFFVYFSQLLYIVTFSYFIEYKNGNKKFRYIFYFAFSLCIIFGFVSGMKGSLILPFIVFLYIDLLYGKKINLKTIFIIMVAVILAYQIITPFRNVLRSGNYQNNRLEALKYTISSSKFSFFSLDNETNNSLRDFIWRMNYTEGLSAIVSYKDTKGLNDNSPDFLSDLVKVPFNAFIPRFILNTKSVINYGLWVSWEVYGMPETIFTSSLVTIEGFFYLIGGEIAVALGYFIVGLILKMTNTIFVNNSGLKVPHIVILSILIFTLLIELNDPVSLFTGLLRGLIIYPIMIKVLYRADKRKLFKFSI